MCKSTNAGARSRGAAKISHEAKKGKETKQDHTHEPDAGFTIGPEKEAKRKINRGTFSALELYKGQREKKSDESRGNLRQ